MYMNVVSRKHSTQPMLQIGAGFYEIQCRYVVSSGGTPTPGIFGNGRWKRYTHRTPPSKTTQLHTHLRSIDELMDIGHAECDETSTSAYMVPFH